MVGSEDRINSDLAAPGLFTEKYGLLSDNAIKAHKGLTIDPFVDKCPTGVISYGLTSFGYDLRIGREYRVFRNGLSNMSSKGYINLVIDPKHFDHSVYNTYIGNFYDLPPHGFALANSMERISMPRDLMAICCGKSTYARCGLVVNVTPIESEFKGTITLELSNTTGNPIRIYSGEGICQVLFFKSPFIVDRSYADKNGIYQNQTGITLPKVRNE